MIGKLREAVLVVFVAFIAYGGGLIFSTIGIDTEVAILDYQDFIISVEGSSRAGLALLKKVLFPNGFNQQLAISLTFVSLLILVYLLVKVYRLSEPFSPSLAACLFVTSPFVYFQYYFQLQSFEVTLGAILVFIGLYLVICKSPWYIPLSCCFIGFSYSIYQALFDFSLAIATYLLLVRGKDVRWSELWKILATILVSFGIYNVLNTYANTTPKSSYLILQTFNLLSLGSLGMMAIIVSTILWHWYVSRKVSFSYYITLALFLCAPFLTIGLTGNFRLRSLFPTLPLVLTAVFIYLLSKKYISKSLLQGVVVGSLGLVLFLQVVEFRRYQEDTRLAQEIVAHIPSPDYRVQFIGKYHQSNHFKIPGEPVGRSFFSYDPIPNYSRSDHMLQLVGANFVVSNLEQNQSAPQAYLTHPAYPSKNYITILEEEKVVLVKFE